MEYRFYLDEVAEKILEMIKDGYHYATITYSEMTQDGETKGYLDFEADDDGGYCGIDYEFIESVDFKEIEEHAYKNKKPPKSRKTIKI